MSDDQGTTATAADGGRGDRSGERLRSLTRYPDRGSDDRADLDRLLDEQWVGTLSTVVDGQPWAVPMLYVRDGDRILLHGSTGAGALRHVAEGAPAVLTVHVMESIVLARTAFDHSADYRSATVRGRLRQLADDEKAEAADAVTEGLVPGRTAEIPSNTRKELAATQLLELRIDDDSWLFKQRGHGFAEADAERPDPDPTWAGVVPLVTTFGTPRPAPGNAPDVEEPASVRSLTGR